MVHRPPTHSSLPLCKPWMHGGAMARPSIVAEEAQHFGRLAGDWWDPNGASAVLHKLNPVRLKYIRDQIDQHWQCDEHVRQPLAGRTALDVGCGAGQIGRAHV